MAATKRVVITGATGLIGKRLSALLISKGYDVVVFTRDTAKARRSVPGAAEYVTWTPSSAGPWAAAIDGAYAVVHLAAANLAGKRWTAEYKKEILDSRVIGTRGIVDAIAAAQHKPDVFVSASAIGYYGARDATPLDEGAAPGNDFAAQVCIAWEREANRAKESGVRTVILRTGVVLDPQEGALAKLKLPFMLFVGGPVLPGTQWFSWIHPEDEVNAIVKALEDDRVRDAINVTAPQAVTNRDFSSTLGKVLNRPSLFPVPGFALRIIAGEVAEMLTTGQRVVPQKLEQLGFQFKHPRVEEALRDLLRRPE